MTASAVVEIDPNAEFRQNVLFCGRRVGTPGFGFHNVRKAKRLCVSSCKHKNTNVIHKLWQLLRVVADPKTKQNHTKVLHEESESASWRPRSLRPDALHEIPSPSPCHISRSVAPNTVHPGRVPPSPPGTGFYAPCVGQPSTAEPCRRSLPG